jgi:osmoprotectant transport system substrate-binding protein
LGTASSTASSTASGAALVIGSQQYYSNEIIAELYAQALESVGFTVTRQYQIGQREIYLPELEAGKIDVIPEYSGNLLQYYDKSATATDAGQIATALAQALPTGLRALTAAAASDQDSYTVTKAFADQYGLAAIGDLTKAPQPLKIAANSEFATRPYGPDGVKQAYGVDLQLVPVEDSGGPLTLRALTDGTVQIADLYTADPSIAKNGLVILSDPKNLILPQNVTPIVSTKVDASGRGRHRGGQRAALGGRPAAAQRPQRRRAGQVGRHRLRLAEEQGPGLSRVGAARAPLAQWAGATGPERASHPRPTARQRSAAAAGRHPAG